jgi:hypothetical protein
MTNGKSRTNLKKTRIATQQGYDICTVNAFDVRELAKTDEEFTNFATHVDFPDLIGQREIWIDERLFEREGIFYVLNALLRCREQERGRSEDRAYAAGLGIERSLRERLIGVKYRAGRPHKRIPKWIYDRSYVTLPDPKNPIEVWLVDGNLVRSFYKTDYTEGGHGYVYAWIPRAAIWIEHDLNEAELPYIVCHEYLELRLMRDEGLAYERAHGICSEVEFEIREGDKIKRLLAPQSGRVTPHDLPQLTSPEVFQYVLKHHVKR